MEWRRGLMDFGVVVREPQSGKKELNLEDQEKSDWAEKYQGLLEGVGDIRKENQRIRMVTGADFSLFAPELVRLKETLASRILAFLLDPNGKHGQRDFFLRRTLQLLPIPALAKIKPPRLR